MNTHQDRDFDIILCVFDCKIELNLVLNAALCVCTLGVRFVCQLTVE